MDCLMLSESFERVNMPLNDIINIEGYTVVSNPYQRVGKGGRPALVLNSEKYHVRNLTQTTIEVPWGVEATWAVLTPKSISSDSIVKKIIVCSFYSKPESRTKSLLLDHISQAFHILSSKYGEGTHFILGGDANDLKIDTILQLSPAMHQLVVTTTRMSPPTILDPVITTLGQFYQTPVCLPPLSPDQDSGCKPSDHKQ